MTNIIILQDTSSQPSIQIQKYGVENNVTGTLIFDTVLVKGLRSTRFIEVEFKNGMIQNKTYITLNPILTTKVNKTVLQSEKASNLTNTELKKLMYS